jgi:TonB family protein
LSPFATGKAEVRHEAVALCDRVARDSLCPPLLGGVTAGPLLGGALLPCMEEESDVTLTHPEPRVVSWLAAQYTEVARKARLQGSVVVVAAVDSEGRVTWVCARKQLSLGLSKAAEEAVKRWRFAHDPRLMRWVEIQFDFRLDDGVETEADRPADLLSPYNLRIWSNTPIIQSWPVCSGTLRSREDS